MTNDSECDISCRDAAMLVCDERDRALTQDEHGALRKHLTTCDNCTEAARQLATLFGQLDELLAK
ncbi:MULTISPECIES: hypothetical protein [Pseudomonas]|uniref:hypothetical protein n=1 Tax=Pseudomonas TaxID=286 RepID=UPI00049B31C1|nr:MULTISPECIES: hypothetical protein [Pseudomonas]AHZ78065.1 hypothetical protein DW66_3558 [Pseudomonas putida]MBP2839335.1 hypothetical protein [Pseudomonas sp. PNP]MCK2122734.1 hypothetical protein [Pseudomonas sp. PNPG3]QUN65194.1 hypothetical protein KDB76_14875 [Pseudomonas sp. JS425]